MDKRQIVLILFVLLSVKPVNAGIVRPQLNLADVQQKARAVSDAEFEKMDKDGDGAVSKQEYENFMNFATGKINQLMQIIQKK